MNTAYRGRFAPSPTGPLHKGSLLAAMASYLEARSQQGEWLVRMEDVDELRNVKGAAESILHSLEAYGFEWDGPLMYQTRRKEAYEQALQQLRSEDRVYPCTCTRKGLRAEAAAGHIRSGPLGYIYPGHCRTRHFNRHHSLDYAIRILCPKQEFTFLDQVFGGYRQNLQNDLGDFIIRRRDGLFAYQLAVVVDDAEQGITHIVRGSDLLDSTPRQLFLQQCLDYPQPQYAHLPLILAANGDKLSKQTGARGIGETAQPHLLVECLQALGQRPPGELARDSVSNIWQWALQNWQLQNVSTSAPPLGTDL